MDGGLPPPSKVSQTAARLFGWIGRVSRRPDAPIAASGLILSSIAIVLLVLGGFATVGDPVAFDLWMLAVGLYVLAGTVVYLGPTRAWARGGARTVPAAASLAQAPAFTDDSPVSASAWSAPRSTARSPYWPGGLPTVARAPSDTIAGQYAEVAREVAARRIASRRASAGGLEEEGAYSPRVSYPGSDRDLSATPPPAEEPVMTTSPGPKSSILQELERLRARVAELEGDVAAPAPALVPDVSIWPGEALGVGPSVCAECGRLLVGGPEESRCPRCGRPMCGSCFGRIDLGPRAHLCADCRRALGPSNGSEMNRPIGPVGRTTVGAAH